MDRKDPGRPCHACRTLVVRATIVLAALTLCVSFLVAPDAHAAWSDDPYVNTLVTGIGTPCRPQVINSGSGFIVIWRNDNAPLGIYAQRYNSQGDPTWGEGVTITTWDAWQNEMVPDGQGGAVVEWTSDDGIYAQRIDRDGNLQWGEDGVLVLEGEEDGWIAPDGEGGAYIMSIDGHVQRVTADGRLAWEDPVFYPVLESEVWSAPKIASDGEGGAILVWIEGWGNNLAVQRIDSDGNLLWNGGLPVYLGEDAYCPRLVTASDGGAVVIWVSTDNSTIFAQKVGLDGEPLWNGGDGLVLDASMGWINGAFIDLASDEEGGAFVTWYDWPDGMNGSGFAQHVDASGVKTWGSPVMFTSLDGFREVSQHPRKTVEDGRGGFIAAWEGPDECIMAQRVDKHGTLLWGDGGVVVSYGESIEYGPRLASGGPGIPGGAIAVWVDPRVTVKAPDSQNVYMQNINADGSLGVLPGEEEEDSYEGVSSKGDDDDRIMGVKCFIESASPGSHAPAVLSAVLLLSALIGVSLRRKPD
ncbi:MAG TPA: hypothetical protein PLS81_12070 [Deltaproteobacteria bacterium]|nr:hypothetical protein [Deltaproteobacteria bacterium]HPP80377.1 hypothetical protein [Deltaproteobacteria bacterium]